MTGQKTTTGPAQQAVNLARTSPVVTAAHTAMGADATVRADAFPRPALQFWRVIVTIEAPDQFSLTVTLDTDSFDHPRTAAPPEPERPYTLHLPHSIQGIWCTDLTTAAATLARLRGEREQAEATAHVGYRRPDQIGAGNPVRHRDTARTGTITLTESGRYAVVVRWHDTDELSYIAPALLIPQFDIPAGHQPQKTVY